MPAFARSVLLPYRPFALLLLLLGAVLLCLSVPAYYYARRPRRGTTEWIKRLDPPSAAPLQVQGLCLADALWSLLIGVCAGALRFAYDILYLRLRNSASETLIPNPRGILLRVLPCVVLAIALYLLLRTMFGRKPLPALLCAIMAGFLQHYAAAPTALLFLSLLCLYAWMSAPYDAPLFFHAFWLVGAGLLYAFALLLCWQAAWLAPFYFCAYLVTQVLRWRGGDPDHRGKKLTVSVLLTLLALLLGTLLLWLLYCILSRRIDGSPVALLRSIRFYRELLPTFAEKLWSLFHGNPLQSVQLPDAFVFLAGLFALPPLLHGIWKLRDMRCLFILCLLPFCLCAWLLGGTYLLPIPLLLSLGRLWQIYTERGRSAYAVGSFGVITLCFFATTILI